MTTTLTFTGILTTGDPGRCSGDLEPGAIIVGDRDVIDEILEYKWSDQVALRCNGTLLAQGPVVGDLGYGYSEWTPCEDDQCHFGDVDIIDALAPYVGQDVTLVIEEPE